MPAVGQFPKPEKAMKPIQTKLRRIDASALLIVTCIVVTGMARELMAGLWLIAMGLFNRFFLG